MRKTGLATFIFLFATGPVVAGDPVGSPNGNWVVADATAVIRIDNCTAPPKPAPAPQRSTDRPAPPRNTTGKSAADAVKDDSLCGTIAWTKQPGGIDDRNPDPTKRGNPIVGTQILLGMKPVSTTRWDGEVYNPENGRIYQGNIVLKSPDVLRIEGCVLGGLFCGGEDWTRAREDPTAATAPKSNPPRR